VLPLRRRQLRAGRRAVLLRLQPRRVHGSQHGGARAQQRHPAARAAGPDPEAYGLYRNPHRDSHPSGIAAELFRRSYSHPDTHIQFVGVWDTVGSLGIPIDGFRPPLLSRLWTFHDTRLSRYVRHAYHAVAIDERRKAFRPTLWERDAEVPGQVLEQLWFVGVHCDVGGGYKDPTLSEIPLLWMADKARDCGLAFKPDRLRIDPDAPDDDDRRVGIHVKPDPSGEKHESRNRFYRLLPGRDRELAGEDGADVAGGGLASSARTRHDEDDRYRPPGLAEWIAAGRPVVRVRDGRD
jgi:type VI secretion system (T6SS) phospholipase Tle1-like effector